ncbi:MAG: HAD family phosphatase [Albidovulum sp.]
MDSILFSAGTQRHVASEEWYSEIIVGGYGAIIFDCDGTLVDSSEAHFQSFKTAVRAQGYDMNCDWYFARTGLDREATLRAFSADINGRFDVMQAAQDSIAAFIVNAKAVSPIPEVVDLIKAFGPAFPMAVGTNAETSVARASLQAVGLIDRFSYIVSVSDGLSAKPSPDIFVEATARLACSAAQTLVFEDSKEGVSAALAAGLDVIHLGARSRDSHGACRQSR